MTHRNHGGIGAQAAPMPATTCANMLMGGRYEVIEESERPGGFAGYKVRHALLDSLLLLTVVPEEVARDAERLARVGAAVRAAGRLRHDHVVPVLDLVADDGRYFVVEPFVDGTPLDHMIATSPLDAPDALHVARQLADALAYAHAAGVFHGAVSPAIILVEDGSPPRASLAGFALAALARSGSAVPAPLLPYTAPERLSGHAPDACADAFALGQVLFELFERKPLLRGSRGEIEALLRDATAPLLPRFSLVVPPGLSGLVARTIRRSPAEREQQMAQVRADLDACLRSAGPADAPEAPAVSPTDPPGAGPVVTPPPPGTMPVRVRSGRRPSRPARARREATFPPRILVRVRRPQRTSLGGKLLMAAATVMLGWALWPFASTPPARCVPAEPIVAPAPVAATSDVPAAGARAEYAAASAEPSPIEGGEPARDGPVPALGRATTLAPVRDADDRASIGTGKPGVRRWAVPGR